MGFAAVVPFALATSVARLMSFTLPSKAAAPSIIIICNNISYHSHFRSFCWLFPSSFPCVHLDPPLLEMSGVKHQLETTSASNEAAPAPKRKKRGVALAGVQVGTTAICEAGVHETEGKDAIRYRGYDLMELAVLSQHTAYHIPYHAPCHGRCTPCCSAMLPFFVSNFFSFS